MKIAVTHENGQIFQHFGHTPQFKFYTVENNQIVSSEIVDTNGSGHGALADLLSVLGANALICGGIGMGAQLALDNVDIQLYAGCAGDADAAVAKLIAGELPQNGQANCDHHHHHEHGHDCSCGHHHDHHHDHHHEHGHDCSCGHHHDHEHEHHHHDGECHCHDHH